MFILFLKFFSEESKSKSKSTDKPERWQEEERNTYPESTLSRFKRKRREINRPISGIKIPNEKQNNSMKMEQPATPSLESGAEVLEMAVNAPRDNKKTRIVPRHANGKSEL